ncbi:MAG: hypothetical protein IJU03_08160 [Thermoguttaceae bacterium]|nr:hypothetical protein [Thermoguttaceae bacterium]
MNEQDEINLRNLLTRYVRCIKIIDSLNTVANALRDDAPLGLYRNVIAEQAVAFKESNQLASMIARNPLIKATAPDSLYEIKLDRRRAPQNRAFFNPFLELLDRKGKFAWHGTDDVEAVDYLMSRLFETLEKIQNRKKT